MMFSNIHTPLCAFYLNWISSSSATFTMLHIHPLHITHSHSARHNVVDTNGVVELRSTLYQLVDNDWRAFIRTSNSIIYYCSDANSMHSRLLQRMCGRRVEYKMHFLRFYVNDEFFFIFILSYACDRGMYDKLKLRREWMLYVVILMTPSSSRETHARWTMKRMATKSDNIYYNSTFSKM